MGDLTDGFGVMIGFYLVVTAVWCAAGLGVMALIHHFTGPWNICMTVWGHGGCL